MALVLADRVQEYSTTTGTGTLTLSGEYAGFQTFAAGIGNGNTCYYTITSDTNQWEVGIGTVGVGTLARTTLISSSTGSLVSFVGTLTVFVTYPAEKAVYSDSTTIVAPNGALLPITSGGTGASTAAGARTALGLGTIATQAANSVAITGGAIDGTTVGSTTAAAGSFTTLNSSGATRLGGLSGNQSLQVNNVASAVNYLQTVGAVTGQYAALTTQGADANVGLLVNTKGTYPVTINSALEINPTASSVNFISFYGAATGGAPVFVAKGSDANVAMGFATKGTQGFAFYTNNFGAQQAAITHTASAVNYLNLTGAATGAAPTISAQGSDANINLGFLTKGTGGHTFSTGGGQQFAVGNIASSVNYLQAQGAPTGSSVGISVQGTDSNISIGYFGKGTGFHFFYTNGIAQASISPTASAVNRVNFTGAATGGAPEVSAQGSDANINLKLTPKGTGTLQFGTYTAGVVAQAGFITITDAAGTSRRLLVG
jgi:phosphotransferase system HPr-like phosphotransfer protein